MYDFLLQQLKFILVVFGLLIIPGWLVLGAFFHKKTFSTLEKFVLSVPISFTLITLEIILLNLFKVPLDQKNILIAIFATIVLLVIISFFTKPKKAEEINSKLFDFSKLQTILVVVLIVFTITVRGMFLINTVFPTATDLGHHMFWVEKIAQEHKLPEYKKIHLLVNDNVPTFSQPTDIADFIEGEHILFAVIKMITNQSVVSTFPSLLLFVINICSILMIFILTLRLFENYKYSKEIAILTLLFSGPLWAISGAGVKFVSGGVVGNVIGNLLLPSLVYFLLRALKQKSPGLLALSILIATGLAYTHHLTSFIFGYAFIFSIIFFVLLGKDKQLYKNIFSLLKNPYIIPILLFCLTLLVFIAPPSYLDHDAITSSVGAPSKSTRTGVPFNQLMQMIGSARFIFGILGLLLLTGLSIFERFSHTHKKKLIDIYSKSFLLGWSWALVFMSLVPQYLKVNIISTRIATYLAFPLAILSGFLIVWFFVQAHKSKKNILLPQFLFSAFLFLVTTFIFVSGVRDNATSLNNTPKTNKALQTFHAGDYASKVFKKQIATNEFWIVKDHNYITSDTWLKVFFAHDYSFPLSRSYFKRYETHPNRETCTLEMISNPKSDFAKTCFDNLNIHAVIVNTDEDAGQFLNNDNFYRIYQNDEISIFIKK